MTTLIVTASSKSKTESTDKDFEFADQTFLDTLDGKYRNQLKEAREELASGLEITKGPDIMEGKVKEDNDKYLPAYIRYTGRTYSKITDTAWRNLVKKPEKYDMVILSALYGLMRYNEPVRNYTIEQKDKINGTRIMTYWKNSGDGAREWLYNYIKQNNYEEVKFVLSTSYSKIIQRDKLIEQLNQEGIPAEDKQFKSAGRASMLKRGSYINDLLLGKLEE